MAPDGTAASTETGELAIISAGVSNKGIKREVNEDAFSILEKVGYQVFLIADGLGGPKRGAVASNLALSSVRIALKDHPHFDNPAILRDAVVRANKDVFEKASASKTLHGMGTTLTGLVIANQKIATVHVGNSRIYKISGGQIERLTLDHTVVEELRREGVEPAKELDLRPKSHLLTRSLGVKPTLEVEVTSYPEEVKDGDVYLLCTDGLHDLVDDAEIVGIVAAHPIKDAAHLLVNLANERGGHDNITVVMMQIGNRNFGIETGSRKKTTSQAPDQKVLAARAPRRLAPLKSRVGEDLPAERAPAKPTRNPVPGRELLDLRERDDEGEFEPIRPAKAGRKRLRPPTPAAASSGGRGAQRLAAAPALGKAPLSRRLPPLTQRIEERKRREAEAVTPVGLLKGNPKNLLGEGAGEASQASNAQAIELTQQSSGISKSSGATHHKPSLLSSPPASTTKDGSIALVGFRFGLVAVVAAFALRMFSTSPLGGGGEQDSIGRKGHPSREGAEDADAERGQDEPASKGGGGDFEEFGREKELQQELAARRDSGRERRDRPEELSRVKEQGVPRVRDAMLREMLADVIDAIQQAVHSAEEVLDQLEEADVAMSHRLKRMSEISREAVDTLREADQNGKEGSAERIKEVQASGSSTKDEKKDSSVPSRALSLEEKKRRLIEGLPDADPFAEE
jgi:serine/threonine protein phosphatase PrpC